MVEPFREHPSLGHTILSFGFADGSYLAFSAEARKEPGEEYGVVAGMLGAFELMDVVADERDVFGLRANVRRDDVYLYPLALDQAERRRVLEAALARLGERVRTPAFYHSLSNNCTTILVSLLRAGRDDILPAWHWSYWLPASFGRPAGGARAGGGGVVGGGGAQALPDQRAGRGGGYAAGFLGPDPGGVGHHEGVGLRRIASRALQAGRGARYLAGTSGR
jgi:hypothetical protein